MEENNNVETTPAVEPQKKKGNVGLIVFLVILVLGLAGYICYDKFIATNNVPSNNSKCKEDTCNCSNKDNTILSSDEALKIVSNIYEKAYHALNGSGEADTINTLEETTINGDVYYKMNIDVIKPYFSNRAFQIIKSNFIEKDGSYYDIYNDGNKHSYLEDLTLSRTIFGGTDQGLRPLTIVSISENVIYATGQLTPPRETDTDAYPLSITFIKENGNWVIDSFE